MYKCQDLFTQPIDYGVVYRWARRMEDDGIAPNTYGKYSWSSRYQQKVTAVHYIGIFQYSVQAQLSVYDDWISCMYVFGAVPSSSILRAHLYNTPSSMIQLMYELSLLIFWIIAAWSSLSKKKILRNNFDDLNQKFHSPVGI